MIEEIPRTLEEKLVWLKSKTYWDAIGCGRSEETAEAYSNEQTADLRARLRVSKLKPAEITHAIKEARARVRLFRQGTQWVVIGPFYFDKPNGPSTHSSPTDYWQARVKASQWRASVAIHLLDAYSYDSDFTARETDGDLRARVRAGLRQFITYPRSCGSH